MLLDEHVPRLYIARLRTMVPELEIRRIGDLDCPPRGTKDPDILRWCEKNGALLVSNDRKTIPKHLKEHLDAGGHIPGVLMFRRKARFMDVVGDLHLIASLADEDEFFDQLQFLPFTELR